MSDQRTPGETELHAYLDGELAPEEAAAVRAWLEADAGARQRAAAYRRIGELLGLGFQAVLSEPVPQRLGRLTRDRRQVWPGPAAGWRQVAAGLLIAALAGTAGFMLARRPVPGPPAPPSVAEAALGAHAVYAMEIRHPVEVGASDREHLARWLGKRLGAELKVPDISGLGYGLLGGRLLVDAGAPAALLMYEDQIGRRLTVYIRRTGEVEGSALQLTSARGLESYSWTDKPFACAVTGNQSAEELHTIAERVYAALESEG